METVFKAWERYSSRPRTLLKTVPHFIDYLTTNTQPQIAFFSLHCTTELMKTTWFRQNWLPDITIHDMAQGNLGRAANCQIFSEAYVQSCELRFLSNHLLDIVLISADL